MSLAQTLVAAGTAAVESDSPVDVLVLGAGPAGLSVGHELKKRGIRFLILERGQSAGESWRRMPVNLKLITPWKANWLSGTDQRILPRHYEMSRAEYSDYLERYAVEQELPIQAGETIVEVVCDDEGMFRVRTASAEYRARSVVNATGGVSRAHVPKYDGADSSSIPRMHVADYRDPEQVRRLVGGRPGPIVIVGKRLSAGQVMVELADAGLEVGISHRSRIRFGGGAFSRWLSFRALPLFEAIKINVLGQATCGFEVTMEAGRARQLIRNGKVRTYPDINRFQGATLLFKDGSRLKPAAVIFATGFGPCLDHLHRLLGDVPDRRRLPALNGMESAVVPGLFFIGLENQRNLRSHYLRGIREDAVLVALEVTQRLDWLNQQVAVG